MTPPSLTLYHAPGTCSLASHILLTHLSLSATLVPMRLSPHDGLTAGAVPDTPTAAWYRQHVHPAGLVPALALDSAATATATARPITETPAILAFLAHLAGPEREAAVLGAPGVARARAAEWMAWLGGTLHGRGFGMVWRPGRFVDDEGAWEGVRAKGRRVVEECFGRVEGRLVGRGAALGDESGQGVVGAVDFYLYVFWRWGLEIGLDMEGQFPSYGVVMRKVEAESAVRKTLQAEGLELSFKD